MEDFVRRGELQSGGLYPSVCRVECFIGLNSFVLGCQVCWGEV